MLPWLRSLRLLFQLLQVIPLIALRGQLDSVVYELLFLLLVILLVCVLHLLFLAWLLLLEGHGLLNEVFFFTDEALQDLVKLALHCVELTRWAHLWWIGILLTICHPLFKVEAGPVLASRVLRRSGLTLRLEQAIVEVIALDLLLDTLDLLFDVDLAVGQAVQVLELLGDFFRKICWLLLKCAIFIILLHFLEAIVIL